MYITYLINKDTENIEVKKDIASSEGAIDTDVKDELNNILNL